jgi:hypothetical protein
MAKWIVAAFAAIVACLIVGVNCYQWGVDAADKYYSKKNQVADTTCNGKIAVAKGQEFESIYGFDAAVAGEKHEVHAPFVQRRLNELKEERLLNNREYEVARLCGTGKIKQQRLETLRLSSEHSEQRYINACRVARHADFEAPIVERYEGPPYP